MRTSQDIERRLKALKKRQVDGVDVTEEIAPLEYFLNVEWVVDEKGNLSELTEKNVQDYAKRCIELGQYSRAVSAIWIISSDRKITWKSAASVN